VLQVWHLFAFAIVSGTLNAFNQPARQTMVFDVVPRAAVPNAIALNSIAGNATRTLGPTIGGGLILLFGPANNFLVQAVAYLCVMVTVFSIQRFPPRQDASRKRSFVKEMAEGYAWAMGNPRARLLVLMMTLYPAFVIPVHSALMPIFAKDVFHTGAGGLGLLLSALGVGGLIGAFLAARLNTDRRGLLQLYSLFVVSGFLVIYGIVGGLTGQLWLGILLLVMSGIGGSLLNTINQTVLQLMAPDRMRGRITGILTVQPVFSSIGILVAGFAADLFGPVAVAMASGSIMFGIGVLILVFSPRMRDLRLSRLTEGAV
jgi:MFS family permease